MSKKDHRSVICFSCGELQRKYAGVQARSYAATLPLRDGNRGRIRLHMDKRARLWSTKCVYENRWQA